MALKEPFIGIQVSSGAAKNVPVVAQFVSVIIFFFDLSTAWKSMTSGDFDIRMLDGSHFYLKDPENEKILLDLITKHLETSEMDYL